MNRLIALLLFLGGTSLLVTAQTTSGSSTGNGRCEECTGKTRPYIPVRYTAEKYMGMLGEPHTVSDGFSSGIEAVQFNKFGGEPNDAYEIVWKSAALASCPGCIDDIHSARPEIRVWGFTAPNSAVVWECVYENKSDASKSVTIGTVSFTLRQPEKISVPCSLNSSVTLDESYSESTDGDSKRTNVVVEWSSLFAGQQALLKTSFATKDGGKTWDPTPNYAFDKKEKLIEYWPRIGKFGPINIPTVSSRTVPAMEELMPFAFISYPDVPNASQTLPSQVWVINDYLQISGKVSRNIYQDKTNGEIVSKDVEFGFKVETFDGGGAVKASFPLYPLSKNGKNIFSVLGDELLKYLPGDKAPDAKPRVGQILKETAAIPSVEGTLGFTSCKDMGPEAPCKFLTFAGNIGYQGKVIELKAKPLHVLVPGANIGAAGVYIVGSLAFDLTAGIRLNAKGGCNDDNGISLNNLNLRIDAVPKLELLGGLSFGVPGNAVVPKVGELGFVGGLRFEGKGAIDYSLLTGDLKLSGAVGPISAVIEGYFESALLPKVYKMRFEYQIFDEIELSPIAIKTYSFY